MSTNIIINLQYEATHCWPDCDIEEVMFLRHPHRHIFHICCKKQVSHLDRDVEIIQLKRTIERRLHEEFNGNLEYWSCEMLAEWLAHEFELNYCAVLEDGENGAEIYKS